MSTPALTDAREWTRAMEFAAVEMELLRLDAILSEPMPSEEEAVWRNQRQWLVGHLSALERMVVPPPPRESINEWLIPQETVDRIWADVEADPAVVVQVFDRLLGIELSWPPGAKEAKAACPFCMELGLWRPGKRKLQVNLATTQCYCWVCLHQGNLRSTLKRRTNLRFRDLMKELGAYVGIIITDPAPRKWVSL